MSDTAEETPAAAQAETMTAATVAPAKKTTAKKSAIKPTHPPVGEMVNEAIAALKEKKGSSLQAIKKYIAANYKLDADKQATFIKKYLKSAVEKKILVQTKGSGAAGSFKLAAEPEKKKKPVASAKKPTDEKKPTAAAKKSPVKKPAAKKPAGEKKSKVVAKSPIKAKPAKKAVAQAKKPKSPKAKKSAAPKTAKPKIAKK